MSILGDPPCPDVWAAKEKAKILKKATLLGIYTFYLTYCPSARDLILQHACLKALLRRGWTPEMVDNWSDKLLTWVVNSELGQQEPNFMFPRQAKKAFRQMRGRHDLGHYEGKTR